MERVIDYNNITIGKRLGSGCNGSCYLTEDNRVFKRINNPQFFENNLRSICGIYVPTYILPQELVVLEETIIGYIMEYVEGVKLKFINKQISLEEYLNALRMAEIDTASLSNLKIHSFDLKSENVIYTPDGKMKVVDTDFYYKDKKNKHLYNENIGALTFGTIDPLFDMYAARFKEGQLENRRGDLIEGKITLSHYIELLLKYMKITNTKNITLEEMSNEIKLLYKK